MRSNTRYRVITGIPNDTYHVPMLYGTVEYIYLYIYISITLYHGLIKQISGITRGDLYVIETPDHTRAVDGALIDFINLQDN